MVDDDLGDALKKIQANQENEAIEWKNKGNDYFKRGDYENAIQNYKNALDIDPNFSDAWNNLGLAYIKIGKIDEAKKCHTVIDSLKKNEPPDSTPPVTPKKIIRTPNAPKSTIRIPTDVSLTDGENPI
jgi:tetratricopeptide (TPR) repeat protein